ncbi:PilN domain-containing protein [Geotalea toluenoxydans]|uniref:PilN domain-containing protein n=1 Tax=Geotalea toluenoxydans TaxID=421624 RepID=UPI0034E196F0
MGINDQDKFITGQGSQKEGNYQATDLHTGHYPPWYYSHMRAFVFHGDFQNFSTKEDIAKTEQEIQQLKAKIGEIDNIKKLQAEVKKKLDILSRLRKEKTGPVSRLALLSNAVPDKLWLTKYTEAAGTISISGVAFSEDDIATFMKNLQSIPDFNNIELQVSEQTEINKTKAKRFDITFKLTAFGPPEPDKAAK